MIISVLNYIDCNIKLDNKSTETNEKNSLPIIMHKYQKYVNEGMAVSDAISMAFESDIDKDVREFTESVGMHSSSLF